MTKIYACLLGNWECLNDDPNCTVGEELKSPSVWWEENAQIYFPTNRDNSLENSLYGQDYVKLHYKGSDYRIHPIFIQVVS